MKRQLILGFLIGLAIGSGITMAYALGRWFGVHGFLVSLDLIVAFLAFASYFNLKQLFGIRIPRLSAVECLVLIAICVILHGLALPAVVTDHHGR